MLTLRSAQRTAAEDRKRFENLRARGALVGFELLRTDPRDGPVRFLGTMWGVTKVIGTSLDTVEAFVRVMGGDT